MAASPASMSARLDILITNATLANGNRCNVGVRAGTIVYLGKEQPVAKQVIDVAGLHLIPGLIDTHIHDRTPGHPHKETIESVVRAALAGGVTTVAAMPNTDPATSSEETITAKLPLITDLPINYYLWIAALMSNINELVRLVNLYPQILGAKLYACRTTAIEGITELDDKRRLYEQGAIGKYWMPTHAQFQGLMDRNRRKIGLQADIKDHCTIQTGLVEEMEVALALEINRQVEGLLWLCHISSPRSLELAYEAKQAGQRVIVETCPHYVVAHSDAYNNPVTGQRWKVNPSLRNPDDRRQMEQYLLQPDYVDVIGSDHAPHLLAEKLHPDYDKMPSGFPGLETTLPLLGTYVAQGKMTLERMVNLTSRNAADALGLTRKGRIEVGADADLVLIDLHVDSILQDADMRSLCGWTPYHGMAVKCLPVWTIARGVAYRL